MSYLENAVKLKADITTAAGFLTDEQAAECAGLYEEWSGDGADYAAGERRRCNGVLYKCLIGHTSQASWPPAAAPSLWARVLIPDPTVIPDWEQPDSTNPYSMGDKVRHNGKVWISDIDGNVWEPGAYGWTEV